MKYNSTRNKNGWVTVSEAIVKGLADDGGLFVPDSVHKFSQSEIEELSRLSYIERAKKILGYFLSDFNESEVTACVNAAYGNKNFETDAVAPVYKLSDTQYVLELWHGPTCAFKDMALQILPQFMGVARRKVGQKEETVILVATSGDTGKAALEGFRDVEGTKIIVFYPENGVSDMQKCQMMTQEGKNVYVCGVKGNFDDAQNGVKEIFTDEEYNKELLSRGFALSSANSINWGRLAPQIVYYFSAYCDMLAAGEIEAGDKVNVCVPTGNFGNILAGYYAYMMGLPVKKFICASNSNNVLTDFINTGTYDRNREFFTTISPSMDILISSNLERLLYLLSDENPELVKEYMAGLKKSGRYTVSNAIREKVQKMFYGGWCDDEASKATIKKTWDDASYVVDPHTAVALTVHNEYVEKTGDDAKTIIASTASPFKFSAAVLDALCGEGYSGERDDFELLDDLANGFLLDVPAPLAALREKEHRFESSCSKDQMRAVINEFLQ